MRSYVKSPAFIASLIAILLWIPMLTSVVETIYWSVRYKISAPAPQGYLIVSLDGDSAHRDNEIITSTQNQAKLVDVLSSSQAHQIYFDLPDLQGTDSTDDAVFFAETRKAGDRLALVLRANYDIGFTKGVLPDPHRAQTDANRVVFSNWQLNSFGMAVSAPSHFDIKGRKYDNIAIDAADVTNWQGRFFGDFAIDPATVKTVAAKDVLNGKVSADELSGATVFVTSLQTSRPSTTGYFGAGRQATVKADIAGIVALKRGLPYHIPDLTWLGLFVVLASFGKRQRNIARKSVVYGALILSLLLLPAILVASNIFGSSELGIVAAIIYAPLRFWQKRRVRDRLTNSVSGLPTVEALALDGFRSGSDVVAVVVSQYEHMLSNLPRDLHGECARQIARRLAVASDISEIHATENGYFVWLEAPCTLSAQVAQLEGLKALFASPLVIGGHLFDTNVHFGLDRNGSDDPMSRIQAALAAAGEAQIKGKLYEEFEQKRRQQSPWELSLHARIDEGLRNGDIWLAFQPQLDIRSGAIKGAEALIRWNDPERGVIPPDSFILQAERAGRIEAITYWVVERAIDASKALAKLGKPIHLSVNLSARMVDHPDLLSRVRQLVERHDFDCKLMTFEVTETFSMNNHGQAAQNLNGLRAMGFRLSIDDFGTGHASLAYLAEIPSDEIKLDKQFIQRIVSDRRERIIVRSVIRLAHSLGHVVCAEGIEDQQTLQLLRQMNCDLAQGYYISRPQRLEAMVALLAHDADLERKAG